MIKLVTQMVFSFALLLGNAAFAVPLSVVESTDFSNSNGGRDFLGNFDIGINTVSGSVLRNTETNGDYGDFWEADLLVGQQITAIDILISNHSGANGFFVGAANDNVGGFGPFTAQAYDNLLADGTYSLAATLGTAYPFADIGRYYFGAGTGVGTDTGYSYEWRITVEGISVPEPASIILLGLGLAGLVVTRGKAK